MRDVFWIRQSDLRRLSRTRDQRVCLLRRRRKDDERRVFFLREMRWPRLRRLRRVQSNGIEKQVVVECERRLGAERRVAEKEREREPFYSAHSSLLVKVILPNGTTARELRVLRVYNVIIIIIIIKKVIVQTGATAPAWRLTDLFA